MHYQAHHGAKIRQGMRTTIQLDDDVAAAVERVRRASDVGLSKAVNDLIRIALQPKQPRKTFQQRSQPLGLRIDVSNVSETLDQLEGSWHR